MPDGSVTVQIESGLPRGVQQGVEVDVTIEVDHLSNVVQVGRPVESQPNSEGALFKLDPNGEISVRRLFCCCLPSTKLTDHVLTN